MESPYEHISANLWQYNRTMLFVSGQLRYGHSDIYFACQGNTVAGFLMDAKKQYQNGRDAAGT